MLKLENLSFQFDGGLPLLDDQSFHLAGGEVLILSGAGGCGKSTLMRILRHELKPESGSVAFFGRKLNGLSNKQCAETFQKIGWVFQDPRLVPHLTVLDNVLLPLHATGQLTSNSQKDALVLLEWFDLHSVSNKATGGLSASQKQCLGLVRALISKPKLLIADEPFVHLEAQQVTRILGLMQSLAKQGMACLITTQKPPIVSSSNWRLCNWSKDKLIENPS